MELISSAEVKAFLKANVFEYTATQPKLCFPIIQRIHYKIKLGIDFENINVADLSVINGHHRYICLLLAGKTVGINPWASPSNIAQYKWGDIEMDEHDWESIYTIGQHNKKDAQRIGLNVDIFDILIKSSPNNA